MSRRQARESAIQFLFSTDFNRNENLDEMLKEFYESRDGASEDMPQESMSRNDIIFAEEIIRGTIENLEKIDGLIQQNTTGWTKERIAKVDLAILRLALYEILYREDIPGSVAINEAIELAKKYSTDDSGGFINGVLGKIVRELEAKGV